MARPWLDARFKVTVDKSSIIYSSGARVFIFSAGVNSEGSWHKTSSQSWPIPVTVNCPAATANVSNNGSRETKSLQCLYLNQRARGKSPETLRKQHAQWLLTNTCGWQDYKN